MLRKKRYLGEESRVKVLPKRLGKKEGKETDSLIKQNHNNNKKLGGIFDSYLRSLLGNKQEVEKKKKNMVFILQHSLPEKRSSFRLQKNE